MHLPIEEEHASWHEPPHILVDRLVVLHGQRRHLLLGVSLAELLQAIVLLLNSLMAVRCNRLAF